MLDAHEPPRQSPPVHDLAQAEGWIAGQHNAARDAGQEGGDEQQQRSGRVRLQVPQKPPHYFVLGCAVALSVNCYPFLNELLFYSSWGIIITMSRDLL